MVFSAVLCVINDNRRWQRSDEVFTVIQYCKTAHQSVVMYWTTDQTYNNHANSHTNTSIIIIRNKVLSYRRETALQGAL